MPKMPLTFRAWMEGDGVETQTLEFADRTWPWIAEQLARNRPGFRAGALSVADVDHLAGPVTAEFAAAYGASPESARSALAGVAHLHHHFTWRHPMVADATCAALDRLVPVVDELEDLCRQLEGEAPGATDDLPLLVAVRDLVGRPGGPRPVGTNLDVDVRRLTEFLREEGYLDQEFCGTPVAAPLADDEDARRLPAERDLVTRWIATQLRNVGATREALLAGLLCAAAGAVVPAPLLVCAARLQEALDEYEGESTDPFDGDELGRMLQSLAAAGISRSGTGLDVPAELGPLVVQAVRGAAAGPWVRREFVARWFATLRGESSLVLDFVPSIGSFVQQSG
ncbi:hypothetical protein [Kineococcus sp. SYSU DK003]|uniref:hypothetical protein n=1 Tax=Kineococcus sp. SYSU DK003 TaxID=3383124 RepID=UPI003D7C8DF3